MDWRNKPAFRNGSTLCQLDSTCIAPSRWNRPDECELEGDRFQRLKASIDAWGGNLQPIQMRHETMPGFDREAAVAAGHRFTSEIVFGHSRHRACLELGLPVLVMSDRMTDVQAFQQSAMELQGDGRWRPWRLARVLCSASDSGLFLSLRKLAATLSMDPTEAWLLFKIGRLPESVRLAYGNLELTPIHAKKLVKEYSKNVDLFKANSTGQSFRNCKTAAAVLDALKREGA